MKHPRRTHPDTTIVGARPPADGKFLARLPQGIEVLVRKASVDPAFKQALLADRPTAASGIGLELSSSEQALLKAVPDSQLRAIIEATVVEPGIRPAFLGRTAAVMLAALSAGATIPEARPDSRGAEPHANVQTVASTDGEARNADQRRREKERPVQPGGAPDRWTRLRRLSDSLLTGELPAKDSAYLERLTLSRLREQQRRERADSLRAEEQSAIAVVLNLRDKLDEAEGAHADSVLLDGDSARTAEGAAVKAELDSAIAELVRVRARLLETTDPGAIFERGDIAREWHRGRRAKPEPETYLAGSIPLLPYSRTAEENKRLADQLEQVLSDRQRIRNAERVERAHAALDGPTQDSIARAEDEHRSAALAGLRVRLDTLAQQRRELQAALRRAEGAHADTVLQSKGRARTVQGMQAHRQLASLDQTVGDVRRQISALEDPLGHMKRELDELQHRLRVQDPAYGTMGMRGMRIPTPVERWLSLRIDSLYLALNRYGRRHPPLPERPSESDSAAAQATLDVRMETALHVRRERRSQTEMLMREVDELRKEIAEITEKLRKAEGEHADSVMASQRAPGSERSRRLAEELAKSSFHLKAAQRELQRMTDPEGYVAYLTEESERAKCELRELTRFEELLKDSVELRQAFQKEGNRQRHLDSLLLEQARAELRIGVLRDSMEVVKGQDDNQAAQLRERSKELRAFLRELRFRIDKAANIAGWMDRHISNLKHKLRNDHPEYKADATPADPAALALQSEIDSTKAEREAVMRQQKLISDFLGPLLDMEQSSWGESSYWPGKGYVRDKER